MSRLALFGGAPVRTRPFPSWPVFDAREEQALLEVLRSGKWWRYSYAEGVELAEPEAGGPRSRVAEFQEAFARLQGARSGIACASGTAALEVAVKALGIGPGDEVIVPAYTFIATASAVLMNNAIPVFADVEPDTLNIDPVRVEEAVTPATRAIIPVHFAGQAADMASLLDIARRRDLRVIEDAAHGHGGSWKNQGAAHGLGGIGDCGTFSFQASKNMTAGEGGLITTSDRGLAELCESYIWLGREKGRPWYEHHRLGWNYRMTEFQGAILLRQLERVRAQNARRRENAAFLSRRLADIPGIRPLAIRDFAAEHTFHIYILRLEEKKFGVRRDEFITALESEGIPCFAGYAHPIYRNPMFLKQDFYPRGCPVNCGPYGKPVEYARFADLCPAAEQACRETVWFEQRLLLDDRTGMDDIVAAIEKIYEHRAEVQNAPAPQKHGPTRTPALRPASRVGRGASEADS